MRAAECLIGLDLDEGWHVDSYLYRPPTSTGEKFSVGYIVTNKDGKKAYLKALDFSIAFKHPDMTRILEDLFKAYNFECDLLAKCKGKKLRRIVTAMGEGIANVAGHGTLSNVPYLISELATGNIRDEVEKWGQVR